MAWRPVIGDRVHEAGRSRVALVVGVVPGPGLIFEDGHGVHEEVLFPPVPPEWFVIAWPPSKGEKPVERFAHLSELVAASGGRRRPV